MLGSFGDIVFEVGVGPSSADHSREVEYAEHDVVGGAPLLERTGRAADEVSMEVTLRAELGIDVQEQIERFRDAADREPAFLTIGEQTLGQYVLSGVDTDYQRAKGDRINQAGLSLTLKEYN